MKKTGYIVMLLMLVYAVASEAQSLDELAEMVRQAATTEGQVNQQREQRFLREHNNQLVLLEQARQEKQDEERRGDALKTDYDQLERELAELETVVQERVGNLGELFGIVRQSSGDIQTVLNDSMVSAQLPGREAFLSEMAQRKTLPTVQELRMLWSAMVTEIAESGKIVNFNATVERANGVKENMKVLRVGVFNAVSNGRYLDWNASTNNPGLIELARQPAARFHSMASNLQQAQPGEAVAMALDFSRGQILRALVTSKTPMERVKEDGGLVGYVIIGIGIFGLLLCLWKVIVLVTTGSRMKRQLRNETADKGNPLGRVMLVYTNKVDIDVETLELKLDEAILRESAPLESGLSFIKVLYVVAPLLGLLGTVVGMITTFQMITLFGTGDPRMMAGGISTALVTTVLGLVVAIPLTLLHAFLQGKSRALIQVLEEQAAGIIARLAERIR